MFIDAFKNTSPVSTYVPATANNAPALPIQNAGTSEQAETSNDKKITEKPSELKTAFQDFVGQTFFSEMIKAMRATQEPAKYFNGGQAEKIFQGQFDQTLAEELSKSSAEKIANPMFELFQLPRH